MDLGSLKNRKYRVSSRNQETGSQGIGEPGNMESGNIKTKKCGIKVSRNLEILSQGMK